ncbi:cupredoxin domain-containing protein [Candidatus Gottesmanbacteria bacterium]|nr:cupredoxin domain-containing protein [Candidatus Gottesmanbacteria bacterium]
MSNKLIITLIVIAALVFGVFYFYNIFVANNNLTPNQSDQDRSFDAINGDGSNQPTKSPEEIKIITELENHTVLIKDNAFSPESITIKVNDQVIWENNDNTQHRVKGDDWGGATINNGGKFAQAFDKPGTYAYICEIHPEMKGTIIVK